MSTTTTNLSTLKINYLTQSQYDTALSNNQINENEIYMTPTEDMTTQEVQDFVDSLDMSGGSVAVVQDIQTVFFEDSSQTIAGGGAVTREGLSLESVVPSGYTPIYATFRYAGNYQTVCYTCTLSTTELLTYQLANRSSSSITITPAFQILCVKKTQ